jgi:hypothetical protein
MAKDPKSMEKGIIYPESYEEPVKDPGAKEARYQEVKEELTARVKAIVKTSPMTYDKVILELSKQKSPGGTYGWLRAIQDVDQEWHPAKFEEAVVEELETPKGKK